MQIFINTRLIHYIKTAVLCFGLLFSLPFALPAINVTDSNVTSTRQEAIEFMSKIERLEPSKYWPNIKPRLFLQNLKSTIDKPLSIYPGSGTNFCGYGALTYLFLKDDPLGYAILLLQLYRDGKARCGDISFEPSDAVKQEAGQFKFTGVLDIHPAEQMWYLTLADHFKGYLNIFNHNYDPGDENTFWASVNYGKFNRMVKELLNYNSIARGSDLMRPRVNGLYNYISEKMKTGTVVLFINNRIVHKKNHVTIKLGVPTHFIVAEKISIENNIITLVYWDYGRKTQLQMSTAFFKRIIFGISYFTKKTTDVE